MTKSNWILAVLEDLRRYSARSGLTDLERQLQQAIRAAREELSGEADDVANANAGGAIANTNTNTNTNTNAGGASEAVAGGPAAKATGGCGGG